MKIKFMNYGYKDLEENVNEISLESKDEPERYCINLYHHDVTGVNIREKDILEVGCGRGGGASYISRYLKPKSYIGLDISKKTIRFCNKFYNVPGLSFIHGHAEKIPFEDNNFDIIVNIESSRCYPDVLKFLHEVYRCLKPGGNLLFSDMRTDEGCKELIEQFKKANLNIIHKENILPNVLEALDLDNDRRQSLILNKMPKFLHKSANEFSGIKGTQRYKLFANGTMQYYHFILQKT